MCVSVCVCVCIYTYILGLKDTGVLKREKNKQNYKSVSDLKQLRY